MIVRLRGTMLGADLSDEQLFYGAMHSFVGMYEL